MGALAPDLPIDGGTASALPAAAPRIADIEMLRGIAIMAVLLHEARGHLIAWPSRVLDSLFTFGEFWPGIDLFFAISGFVIARSLLPALDACTDDGRFLQTTIAFWIRRAWRLLPAAWLWLAVLLAASAGFNRSGVFGPFSANVATTVATIAAIDNLHEARAYGTGAVAAGSVFWCLSLEMQFYLLLPAAAYLLRRRLAWLAGALVVVQIFLPRDLFMLVTRCDALLLGTLLAIWSRHPTYRLFEPTGLRAGPALLVVALIGLSAVASDHLNIISFRIGIIGLVSAGLVFIASHDRDYLWPPGRLKRLMVWLGSRSYALYVSHIPAFYLTREFWYRRLPEGAELGPADTLHVVLTALPLLFLLSEATYLLVEAPLRRRGAAFAAGFAARPLAAA